ncbi:MAG: phosphate/phosphite/phosphonate ABC transporter substrate-binding protein [Pseudomonadota bacterium]
MLLALALGLSTTISSAKVIKIGSISDEPTRESKRLRDFARYLAVELADRDVEAVDVVIAPSTHSMAQMLRDGRVDFYIDGAYPTAIVTRATGSRPVLRRWRSDGPDHRSVLFVRASSSIRTLPDLRGATIALEGRFSTASYFLPKAAVAGAGLEIREIEGVPPDDVVAYRFSGDDRNTLLWVLRGKTQAGAMSLSDYERLSQRKRDELRVLHTSQPVDRSLISHRRQLDDATVDDVKRILLNMHQTYVGQIVLSNFEGTTKFEEFLGGTTSLMTTMRGVGRGLSDELGF